MPVGQSRHIAHDALPESMPNHVYSVDVPTPRASQDLSEHVTTARLTPLPPPLPHL